MILLMNSRVHRRFAVLICVALSMHAVSGFGRQKIPGMLPWSVRMAESVMLRNPEPWTIDFTIKPKWNYTQGLVLLAIQKIWISTGDRKYFDYGKKYCDTFVEAGGAISGIKIEDYNLDNINAGKLLFAVYRENRDEKYKKALNLLRSQFEKHPRTQEGGFWHKKIYPHQMWLDGLYMGSPFLAEFAKTFNEPALFDEVARQLLLMEKHARDEKTGLLYHGWDESHQQKWADPITGKSPHFWGRGMGWYAMAIVDVLDFFPQNHPKRFQIIAILNRLAEAVSKVQDKETGLWYQVLDQGKRKGNYLESTASTMFVYTLAKAVKNGYLGSGYLEVAKKGYNGILKHFITVDSDGIVHIHQANRGSGLGGNPYRDGTYEYYIGEKIGSDDSKASGSFILGSLEFESIKNSIKW